MSHHLDSPIARKDPRLNITDLYVFDAGAATVLVMNVRTSLAQDTHPDPFHPEGRYEFKIHLDGNDREDLTYRWAFEPAHEGRQSYRLERLAGDEAEDDAATGTVIARGRTGEHVSTEDGGQAWAGAAVEPFYLDLGQLHEVQHVVQLAETVDLTRWVRGVAEDSFAGSTVRSIVLTTPVGIDGLTTGRHLSAWATAKLATDAGGWRQVGRTALPMIWPIFRPADSDESNRPNETHPADDPATYGADIAQVVSSTVARLGTSGRPDAHAENVVERIVPDLLRYVVGSTAAFGFGQFNGRRLSDNAPEAMFSLTTNSAVPTGLGAADVQRSQEEFPFVIPVDN